MIEEATTSSILLPRGCGSIVILASFFAFCPSRRERRGDGKGRPQRTRYSKTARKTPARLTFLYFSLALCLSLIARPLWIGSISKIHFRSLYSLACIHTSSSRVFQTSLAMSLMRSRGKTAKSPSPYLAIMKRAARRVAACIISRR